MSASACLGRDTRLARGRPFSASSRRHSVRGTVDSVGGSPRQAVSEDVARRVGWRQALRSRSGRRHSVGLRSQDPIQDHVEQFRMRRGHCARRTGLRRCVAGRMRRRGSAEGHHLSDGLLLHVERRQPRRRPLEVTERRRQRLSILDHVARPENEALLARYLVVLPALANDSRRATRAARAHLKRQPRQAGGAAGPDTGALLRISTA
jgi:hypothetical protein